MFQGLLLMPTLQTELQVDGVIFLFSCEYTFSASGCWTYYFSQHKISIEEKSNTTEEKDYNNSTFRGIPPQAH